MEQIIAILLRHSAHRRDLVEKRWREFVSLQPDPTEVEAARGVVSPGYEIRPLMRSILLSAQFPIPPTAAR